MKAHIYFSQNDKIGTGSYATVKLGVDKASNDKVAIKLYEKYKLFDP